jgi:hypothetical protein
MVGRQPLLYRIREGLPVIRAQCVAQNQKVVTQPESTKVNYSVTGKVVIYFVIPRAGWTLATALQPAN